MPALGGSNADEPWMLACRRYQSGDPFPSTNRRRFKMEAKMMELKVEFDSETHYDQPIGS